MASAIIGGILKAGLVPKEQIIATAKTGQTLCSLQERFGIRTASSNPEAAKAANILFLAVKPHLFPEIIAELKDCVSPDTLLVSIAAGQSISAIDRIFPRIKNLICWYSFSAT